MSDLGAYKINPKMRLCSKYLKLNWIPTSPGMLQAACPSSCTTKDCWVTARQCRVLIQQIGSELDIYYLTDVDWENRLLHAWIRKRIKEYVYTLAEIILPDRLHMWERIHNIHVPDGVIVKKLRQNTLGYCTGRKIALSPKILLLPEPDMDSVILHEMAHLKHMHHRKSFWNHLTTLLGEDSQVQKLEMDIRSAAFYAYSDYLLK